MKKLMKVEIPFGCQLKYEEDKETGLMVASRIVPVIYPHAYGYIPNTLAEDNDPLDIFLIDDFHHYRDIYPGVMVNIDVLGMIDFIDEGEIDHKIVGKLHGTTESNLDGSVKTLQRFLTEYKPGAIVKVGEFKDRKIAEEYVTFCEERYEK